MFTTTAVVSTIPAFVVGSDFAQSTAAIPMIKNANATTS
jgi:hypothetical protein